MGLWLFFLTLRGLTHKIKGAMKGLIVPFFIQRAGGCCKPVKDGMMFHPGALV